MEDIREEFVFFVSHKDKKTGYLSNWFLSDFEEDGKLFNCAEQYMMYYKALLMSDKDTAAMILTLKDPKSIKAAGRRVTNWNEKLWDGNKIDIVTNGLRLKFKQNKDLAQKLLATKDRVLVEAAHYDKVWGIGLRASDPDALFPEKWRGQNLLGQCLMVVRDELSKK